MRYALPQAYEDLGHTADVGIRVRGASAEEALARLVLAVGTLLGAAEAVRPFREDRVRATAAGGLPAIAVALLRELLFRFATERLLPVTAEVERLDEGGAEVTIGFTRYDPDRHGEGADVKAVTWHAARLEPEGNGWVAQVVLDI